MSRFATMRKEAANTAPATAHAPSEDRPVQRQANRVEKKAIAGYFSPEMSIAMRTTATRQGMTLQEAMADAFNDWLRKNGESPIGQ